MGSAAHAESEISPSQILGHPRVEMCMTYFCLRPVKAYPGIRLLDQAPSGTRVTGLTSGRGARPLSLLCLSYTEARIFHGVRSETGSISGTYATLLLASSRTAEGQAMFIADARTQDAAIRNLVAG
jgi:hypothetical protein